MSKINKTARWMAASVCSLLLLTACNKDLPVAVPAEHPANGVSPTIGTILNDPNYSIFKSAVTKAGLLSMLNDATLRLTVFAPDNAAVAASGLSQAVVDALPASQIAGIVMYNIVPQTLTLDKIPGSFPNLQYPSILNPAPNISPLLRLSTFPSKRGTVAYVNNIPIVGPDNVAVNGVVQKTALVVTPPTQFLWDRINTDPNLTYLKAAIIRADSGAIPANSLQGYLQNIGANFTVFAPTDSSFKAALTSAIYPGLLPIVTQQLIAAGYSPTDAAAAAPFLAVQQAYGLSSTPDVFKNPLLFGALTAETVKGIVVYHLLGSRAFSVNLPTTATNIPTVLNSAISAHPGVTVTATAGLTGVSSISVKGLANVTAANVLINPYPNGTSDQHYLNGVLHVINQVLLPQ